MNNEIHKLCAEIIQTQKARSDEFIRQTIAEESLRDWSQWDELNTDVNRLRNQLVEAVLDAYVDEMRHKK